MSETTRFPEIENENINERQKRLTVYLNEAARVYEQEDRELISNYEYDRLYDELVALEKETGIVLTDSPTHRPGYEVLSDLEKFRHETPMLSLDKTKDRDALRSWLNGQEALLSWKMDGLTVVLTYRDGELFRAVTRGNGEVGEVVTNNAKVFQNLPARIPYQGELVLRGEAVIRYSDFEKINEKIEDAEAKYKNPRNLCSGAVRQLNNRITAERKVNCFVFSLISMRELDSADADFAASIASGNTDGFPTRREQMEWLKTQGFDVVEYEPVTEDTILAAVESFAEKVTVNDLPSDGLVLTLNDIAYGRSLGRTSKFPRDAIAFKWADEIRETTLLEIEWSASRTGLINPVAIFEPVELEGTTVSRASVHNVSIVESLELGIGDRITVYKANMIIPQIAENLTRSNKRIIPAECPVCGGATMIKQENDVKALFCTNPDCQAKKIKAFAHFVGRDAMNIEGLSEATIEKLIVAGCIREFADLFRLEAHRETITAMEGFGEKSYENLIAATEKAKSVPLARLIYSLGITNVGLSNAKLICNAFEGNLDRMRKASEEELTQIEGIGAVIAQEWCRFFANEKQTAQLDELLTVVTPEFEKTSGTALSGKTFVITGSVEQFANRNELKAYIEQRGGKVSGSVSAKTDFLINNDSQSNSTKNKTAKSLGVAIITEQEFLAMIGES